jgi:hypothetical protein
MMESSFADENEARRYAHQELSKRPDISIAMIAMIGDRAGQILLAHPPDYNPWKDLTSKPAPKGS